MIGKAKEGFYLFFQLGKLKKKDFFNYYIIKKNICKTLFFNLNYKLKINFLILNYFLKLLK
jgi:hypothetical protein